jgi:hypothetical protein
VILAATGRRPTPSRRHEKLSLAFFLGGDHPFGVRQTRRCGCLWHGGAEDTCSIRMEGKIGNIEFWTAMSPIGTNRTCGDGPRMSAFGCKSEIAFLGPPGQLSTMVA